MAGRLQGRVAIVAGGSMGIGKAIARRFAEEGCRCVLTARTQRPLEAAVKELSSIGPPVIGIPCDVASEGEVQALVQRAVAEFGRIDILVNSAGVYGPIGPSVQIDATAWWEALRSNLLGTFLCIRHAVPEMVRSGGGRVINLSGGGATSALPNFSSYACAKAAVVRLTETLAEELKGSGVCVNAIAPGPVNTRLLEQVLAAGEAAGEAFLQRARGQKAEGGVSPERAAELAVYLASEASEGLTGRLISAVWDDWRGLTERIPEVMATDLYTLRRVVEEGGAAGQRPPTG